MSNVQFSTVATFPASGGRKARIGDHIIVAVDVDAYGNPADPVLLVPAVATSVDDNGITGWSAINRPDITGGSLVFDDQATGLADLRPWYWVFDPTTVIRTPVRCSFSAHAQLPYSGDGLRLVATDTGLEVYGIDVTAAGGAPDLNEILLRCANTSNAVTLKHNDNRASAGGKLMLSSGADHVFAPGELLWAVYQDSDDETGAPFWAVDDAGQ